MQLTHARCIQWSSSANRSPAPSSNEETPTEERGVEGQAGRESPSLLQNVRLPFQERDKGGGSLAKDIELRRLTNERLYSAAEAYWSSLSELDGSAVWNFAAH